MIQIAGAPGVPNTENRRCHSQFMEFNTLCLILSIAAVVLCAVFFAAGILYRKKVAEKQIGSAEEEAKRKAEEERKEQERLTQEAEKFNNGEHISGSDVVDLCRRYGIKVHLRTVHNLQQVIYDINHDGYCRYYRTRSKRRPVLDGCYKTAEELYEYLKNHPTETTEICE